MRSLQRMQSQGIIYFKKDLIRFSRFATRAKMAKLIEIFYHFLTLIRFYML